MPNCKAQVWISLTFDFVRKNHETAILIMSDKLSVSQFWEKNYSILQETKGYQCPSPHEVYSEFIKVTGLKHIDLDGFKVISLTCSFKGFFARALWVII